MVALHEHGHASLWPGRLLLLDLCCSAGPGIDECALFSKFNTVWRMINLLPDLHQSGVAEELQLLGCFCSGLGLFHNLYVYKRNHAENHCLLKCGLEKPVAIRQASRMCFRVQSWRVFTTSVFRRRAAT